MSQSNQELYLSLENFFLAHAERLSPLIGERVAQHAWALKDQSIHGDEAEGVCRRVQAAIEKALAGRAARWELLVSESHDILSLEEWIEASLEVSGAAASQLRTKYGDLDLNVETQLHCGMQLEAFHGAQWAKSKLLKLFETESFQELEPLSCRLGTPLPQVIDKLDRDLEFATKGGMRHPYKCSVAVGVVCLKVDASKTEPELTIPVVRRVLLSDVPVLVSRMREELKDRFKGLIAAIQEQQEHLRLLPEGWPNAEVWATMQEWKSRRFLGDNGLMGSDFFEGTWLATELPHDVHRRLSGPTLAPVQEPEAAPLEALKLGLRMAARRAGSEEPLEMSARAETLRF